MEKKLDRFEEKIFHLHDREEISHWEHSYKFFMFKCWNWDNKDTKIIDGYKNSDITIVCQRQIYYDKNNKISHYGDWKVVNYEVKTSIDYS